MNDIVVNALKDLNVPLLWQLRPRSFPCLTYTFITASGQEWEEGEEIATSYLLQVDVWSKNDYEVLTQQIIERLKVEGFKRELEEDDYESDTNIYLKILRFNYLKNLK